MTPDWSWWLRRLRWEWHWLAHRSSPFRVRTPNSDATWSLPRTNAAMGVFLNGGESSPGVADLYRSVLREGDTAMDIGSHIGEYVWIAADVIGPAGTIHAFEPDRRVYAFLRENVVCLQSRGKPPTIITNQVALCDKLGSGELILHEDATDTSLVFGSHATPRVAVPLATIDSYMRDRELFKLDIVRMNAEGAEASVLRGSHGTMSRGSPRAWIIECHSEHLFGECREILGRYGYHIERYEHETVFPYIHATRSS